MSAAGVLAAERATVAELLARASRELQAAGVDTPRLDAELLLAHALGSTRERILIDASARPDPAVVADFEALVHRRSRDREPVAYSTRTRHFRAIELSVDRRALIPRPETEVLVEAALALEEGASVIDVGTGSGAIALALKDERPDLRVTGSDISEDALALARQNSGRLGIDVSWVRADLLLELPDDYDVVLCNPPYVAEHERASLAPEILRHEPPEALFAGEDGLAVIERLIGQLRARPRVRVVLLEVGAGQAGRVGKMLADAGFSSVRAIRDLAGIERVLHAERVSPAAAGS